MEKIHLQDSTREQLVSAMVNIDALTSQMLKLLAKQKVQDIKASIAPCPLLDPTPQRFLSFSK